MNKKYANIATTVKAKKAATQYCKERGYKLYRWIENLILNTITPDPDKENK